MTQTRSQTNSNSIPPIVGSSSGTMIPTPIHQRRQSMPQLATSENPPPPPPGDDGDPNDDGAGDTIDNGQPPFIDAPSSQNANFNAFKGSTPKYSLTKLTGPNNYDSWISVFMAHLTRLQLRNAATDPQDPQQDILLAEIMFNVADDIISCYLLNATTGYEALQILHEAFGLGVTNTFTILTKLTTIKASKYANLSNYIDSAIQLHSTLKKSGTAFSDFHLCCFLLQGLDFNSPQIQTFKAIHTNSLNEKTLTLPFLIRSLREIQLQQTARVAHFAGRSNQSTSLKRPCRHCGGRHFDNQCTQKNRQFRNSRDNRSSNMPQTKHVSFFASTYLSSANQPTSLWLLDTGASHHYCSDPTLLSNVTSTNVDIQTANGPITCQKKGSLNLQTNSGMDITLLDVHVLPGLTTNLLSSRCLLNVGAALHLNSNNPYIELKNSTKISLQLENGLFYLAPSTSSYSCFPALKSTVPTRSLGEWHDVFHRNTQSIIQTSNSNFFQITKANLPVQCNDCTAAKATFPTRRSQSIPTPTKPLPHQIISVDIKGPYSTACENFRYDLKILDHGSDYCTIHLLETKSQATNHIINYIKRIHQRGHKILKYFTDGAQELSGKQLQDAAEKYGFEIHQSTPHNHTNNSKVERLHRTLNDTMNAQLSKSNLPPSFWGYSLLTANYHRNLLFSSNSNGIPQFLFDPSFNPRYDHLQPFGRLCFIHFADEKKIPTPGPKAFPALFIGYGNDTPGIQFKGIRYIPISSTDSRIKFSSFITYPKQITFPGLYELTNSAPLTTSASNSLISPLPISPVSVSTPIATSPPSIDGALAGPIDTSNILQTKRNRRQPSFSALLASSISFGPLDPKNTREAHASANSEEWKLAEQTELKNLISHGTYTLVPPSSSSAVRPIGCKMVYKTKLNPDGSILKRKCRLVAHGFSQEPGVDYTETYAPTLRSKTFRIFLAIAASRNMQSLSMDVSSAFLYPSLDSPLLMKQPKGLEVAGKEDWLMSLNKCLYGLRQSGHEFNELLVKVLISLNFIQLSSSADECVFFKRSDDILTIILVYVDDLAIFSDSAKEIETLSASLQKHFKMTASKLSWFLGLELLHQEDSIKVNQQLYITKLLENFQLTHILPAATPIETSYLNNTADSPLLPPENNFRSLLGSLLHLATQTRFDIQFAISKIASQAANPSENDYNALIRVCRYLKSTSNYCLSFARDAPLDFVGFSDADFAEDKETRKSTTGSIWTLAGTAVSWFSKQQELVTLSSTEAELVAATFSIKEGLWINRILQELGLNKSDAITLCIDNQSTINIISGSKITQRTKHIDVKYMHARELFKSNRLLVRHVPTEDNLADIGTKPLNGPRLNHLSSLSGLSAALKLRGKESL